MLRAFIHKQLKCLLPSRKWHWPNFCAMKGLSFVSRPKGLGSPRLKMRIVLKYGPEGEQVIQGISRISKPGLRVYRASKKLPRVYNGLGLAIVSTSTGLMTDRQARKSNAGGEISRLRLVSLQIASPLNR